MSVKYEYHEEEGGYIEISGELDIELEARAIIFRLMSDISPHLDRSKPIPSVESAVKEIKDLVSTTVNEIFEKAKELIGMKIADRTKIRVVQIAGASKGASCEFQYLDDKGRVWVYRRDVGYDRQGRIIDDSKWLQIELPEEPEK